MQMAFKTIAFGRETLANSHNITVEILHKEGGTIDNLVKLLWHESEQIRQSAVFALAGGDLQEAYTPSYGYFAGYLLRGLEVTRKLMPDSHQERLSLIKCIKPPLLKTPNAQYKATKAAP